MRCLAMILLVAGGLVACDGVAIGPVDHSCHVNPQLSRGSGCSEHGSGGGGGH
jgi:hypothetical protein